MATYAIGDIQGCFEPLQRLLALIEFDPQRDQLWLAGDLVNRGPQSLEVLRWAKAMGDRVVAVLGNHDLHLLACHYTQAKRKRSDTLDEILSAPDCDELMEWLRHRPLVHLEGQWFMSHAGLLPQWTAEQAMTLAKEVESELQSKGCAQFLTKMYGNEPNRWSDDLRGTERSRVIVNALTRMRFINEECRMDFAAKEGLESAPEGYMPWFDAEKKDSAQILFGHWAALGGQTGRTDIHALDTGCVWDGSLTAMNLETLTRYSVPAQPDL
ncbi:MAG: symmetrical bis(5'-nucleosyl)-tetraphosphatase [Oceanobacter sp.]